MVFPLEGRKALGHVLSWGMNTGQEPAVTQLKPREQDVTQDPKPPVRKPALMLNPECPVIG